MKFDHYIPCDTLKTYISTIVVQETTAEQTYKVLPGTGLVIGFQYKGKLSLVRDAKKISLASAGISGLSDTVKLFTNSANIGSVLVYFKEGMASSFFAQPLHELFRESVSLENFMLRSELLLVEEQLNEAKSDQQKVTVVEQFLLSRLKPAAIDKLVVEALALIHREKGNIRVSVLADLLNISQSPLEKRFRKLVGTSPKKFASIVRIKNTIETFSPANSLTDLSYAAGFYDQSHFIKEFKTFTGETPEDFFEKK